MHIIHIKVLKSNQGRLQNLGGIFDHYDFAESDCLPLCFNMKPKDLLTELQEVIFKKKSSHFSRPMRQISSILRTTQKKELI